MSKNPKKKREITDAELLTFAFKDVRPLPGREIKKQNTIKQEHSREGVSKRLILKKKAAERKPKHPNIRHVKAPSLDRRTARRLKKGQIKIDARLDLHGYNQDSAHKAITDFLTQSANSGKRCVLIITGKGLRKSDGGNYKTGVLRELVPQWLNEQPLRSKVLSFDHASHSDGGEGALYVLIKKKRG